MSAALGSALLTGAIALGLQSRRLRHEDSEQRRLERRDAYAQLYATSAMVDLIANSFHVAMQSRSGIGDNFDVTLYHRRPVDPLELHDRMYQVLDPLSRAAASVRIIGSKDAVLVANKLFNKASTVMDKATETGEARSGFLRRFQKEKWTPEQNDARSAAGHALAQARRELAELARREIGSEFAELFVVPEPSS